MINKKPIILKFRHSDGSYAKFKATKVVQKSEKVIFKFSPKRPAQIQPLKDGLNPLSSVQDGAEKCPKCGFKARLYKSGLIKARHKMMCPMFGKEQPSAAEREKDE